MSSIDAAIIKALVEHIGGNPDSIPDETSISPKVVGYKILEITQSDGRLTIVNGCGWCGPGCILRLKRGLIEKVFIFIETVKDNKVRCISRDGVVYTFHRDINDLYTTDSEIVNCDIVDSDDAHHGYFTKLDPYYVYDSLELNGFITYVITKLDELSQS